MSRNRNVLVLSIIVLFAACGSKPEPQVSAESEHGAHEADKSSGKRPAREGTLVFTKEEIDASGIVIATAGPARIAEVLPLYGTVQPNAERVRTVAARFPGVIEKVNVTVGDRVTAGAVLATVESDESLQTYNVTAPLSGTVTSRNANTGESTGDAPLFTVADLATVWIELALFPRDLARVKRGQAVRVRTVDGGLEGIGELVYIAPITQAGQQTISARVLLDNKQGRWAPGLYVAAEVVAEERVAAVAVQSEALQRVGSETVVFVRTDAGFRVQSIDVGSSDRQWTEVKRGLSSGEQYAAVNSFVLKSDLSATETEHEH